jgi:nucleoid-associated protein YgaU
MLWLQDARETVVAEPHVGAIPENVLRPESTDRIAAPAEIGRVSAKAPPASKRRAWLLITGVAIALIAVLYAVNGFMKGGIDDAGKGEQAGTAVKADSARGPEPVARASAPGTSPNPALLRAPRDGGLGPGMYKVKRGDSLWRIAKRLTGNPLNYHRLASENDIANPDVIFPGQKLLVKREE